VRAIVVADWGVIVLFIALLRPEKFPTNWSANIMPACLPLPRSEVIVLKFGATELGCWPDSLCESTCGDSGLDAGVGPLRCGFGYSFFPSAA